MGLHVVAELTAVRRVRGEGGDQPRGEVAELVGGLGDEVDDPVGELGEPLSRVRTFPVVAAMSAIVLSTASDGSGSNGPSAVMCACPNRGSLDTNPAS